MINAISMAQMPQRSFQTQNNKNAVSFGSSSGNWAIVDAGLIGASSLPILDSGVTRTISTFLTAHTGIEISEAIVRGISLALVALLSGGFALNLSNLIRQKQKAAGIPD